MMIQPKRIGGLAPFVITWPIATAGDKTSPVHYVVFSARVGAFGLLRLRERHATIG